MVTYIDLEGGFYAIIGSTEHDPLNLPENFKVEEIYVHFKAMRYNDHRYHM